MKLSNILEQETRKIGNADYIRGPDGMWVPAPRKVKTASGKTRMTGYPSLRKWNSEEWDIHLPERMSKPKLKENTEKFDKMARSLVNLPSISMIDSYKDRKKVERSIINMRKKYLSEWLASRKAAVEAVSKGEDPEKAFIRRGRSDQEMEAEKKEMDQSTKMQRFGM